MVVGKIGARHQEDLLPFDRLGDGRSKALARLPRPFRFHHQSDELERLQRCLKKRQLDLEGMFLRVGFRDESDVLVFLHQGPGELNIDRHDTERCPKPSPVVDRNPPEESPMARSNHDHRIAAQPFNLFVGVSGHLT